MDDEYEVHTYSYKKLVHLLSANSEASEQQVDDKLHAAYFRDYFEEIGAHTIVIEKRYVDRDFLEDYAEYYVRCFHEYPRKCTRFHFFRAKFKKRDFDRLFSSQNGTLTRTNLNDSYLGFVVVKPLPQTIVGRTCLKTYEFQDRRYFPITRRYSVNLYGLSLEVKETLAYQEQDNVVAACATSALWSVFQGTGMLFQHAIPSPAKITVAATEEITSEDRTRRFPSQGLDVIEMARAVKSVGLEAHPIRVADHYVLRGTVYAYLRAGIPMLLGFHLVDVAASPNSLLGKHAVAVTGYSLPTKSRPIPFGPFDFRLRANGIDKLYVHDDQVGPFARMTFDGTTVTLKGTSYRSMATSWRGSDQQIGTARGVPDILLVPLYHKIRIPFGTIHDQILELDTLLTVAWPQQPAEHAPCDPLNELEWDIYLTTVNHYKQEIFSDTATDAKLRRSVLLTDMPKFLWRATAYYQSARLFDLLFDATDIEQGPYFLLAVSFSSPAFEFMKEILAEPAIDAQCRSSLAWPLIEKIRES